MTTRFLQFSEPSQLQGIEILFPRGIGTWQQMQQNDASFTKFIHPLTDNFRKFLCKNCNWWEKQCRWVRSRGGDPGLQRVWLQKQKAARTAQCTTSFILLLARQFCSSTERWCYSLPEYCLASFLWDPLSMRPIFNMTKYIQTSWDVCSVLFQYLYLSSRLFAFWDYLPAAPYLIFVAGPRARPVEKKSVMWRNFKFLYMKHVEKAKISPHVD